jgi:quinol monooxygenase YgiN
VILIVVKWSIKPEYADTWLDVVHDFTEATRAESGNLFFEWSRSVDDPTEYVLVEAFADAAAGGAHVGTDHFKTAIDTLADYVTAKPRIINVEIPDRTDWSEMGEISPR